MQKSVKASFAVVATKKMIMKALLLSTVVCLFAVLVRSSPSCQSLPYGRACTGLSVTRLSLAGQVLLVGGNNSLYSFETWPDLELKEYFSIAPDGDRIKSCKFETSTLDSGIECGNVVRLLQPVPSSALSVSMLSGDTMDVLNNSVMVCGTNAFHPKCTFHKIHDLSDWTYLSNQSAAMSGFSPYSVTSKSVGLLGSDGRFYTGANFGRFSPLFRISVAPYPLHFNTSFGASTPPSSPIWFSISSTEFVDMHEVGDYIYVFLKEPAFERRSVVYSRVVRFCKTDPGIFIAGLNPPVLFRTFQKARITCPHSRHKSAPTFYYDNIVSTHLNWQNDSTALPMLYATFSSSINGPQGTAVCKFSFDSSGSGSINSLFGNTKYYVTGSDSPEEESAFACPGSNGRQRTDAESKTHQLAVGNVLPVGNAAILTQDGQKFTAIVVDIFKYNGKTYEAVYVGTKDGNISMSLFADNVLNVSLKDFINLGEQPVTQLILSISNETQIRRLYASTEGLIADVTLGNCSRYESCKECLESRDPYCIWQGKLCINKLSVTQSTVGVPEAIDPPSNMDSYCGVTPTQTISISSSASSSITTTKLTDSTTSVTITTTTSSIVSSASTSTKPLNASTTKSSTGVSNTATVRPSIGPVGTKSKPGIGETVGAVVGGLVIGFIMGAIICFIGLACKRKLLKNEQVVTNPHRTSNGSAPVATASQRPRQRHGSVGHYTITIDLPGGGKEEVKVIEEEENGNGTLSPPSPVVIDSELEDDAIADLPPPPTSSSSHSRYKKSNRGRTESTRWLRASESEASTNGTESPQSP